MLGRILLSALFAIALAPAAHAWPFFFTILENPPGTPTNIARIDLGGSPPPVAHCGNLGGPGIAVHPNAGASTFYLHSGGRLRKLVPSGGGCLEVASVATRNYGLFDTQGMAISANGATVWVTDDAGYVGVHDANTLAEIAYAYLTSGGSGPLCKIRMIDVHPGSPYEAVVSSANCNVKRVGVSGTSLWDWGAANTDGAWGIAWAPDASALYAVRAQDGADRLVRIDAAQMKKNGGWDLVARARDVVVRHGWAFAPAVTGSDVVKMVAINLGGGCDPVLHQPLASLGKVQTKLDGLSRYGEYLYVLAGDVSTMAQYDTVARGWTGWTAGVGSGVAAMGPFTPLY